MMIMENTLIKKIQENKETNKLLKNHEIIKTIFLPNRLINIIIKDD